jgi:hypothetical protein
MARHHIEKHRTGSIAWLRAAVLGANDGIVSTASLVIGVAAAHATHADVMVAGVAGMVAGAMSMAAGEYVSVHSQADTEKADIERERMELATDYVGEHKELTAIYVNRGLDPALAQQVAQQLMDHDAIGAHARDELGITEEFRGRRCRYWSLLLHQSAVCCCWLPRLPCCFSRFLVRWRLVPVVQALLQARCALRSGARWRWGRLLQLAPCLAPWFKTVCRIKKAGWCRLF